MTYVLKHMHLHMIHTICSCNKLKIFVILVKESPQHVYLFEGLSDCVLVLRVTRHPRAPELQGEVILYIYIYSYELAVIDQLFMYLFLSAAKLHVEITLCW